MHRAVFRMFDRKGLIVIDNKDGLDGDELMMAAIEAGAEDVSDESGVFEIYTDPAEFSNVREAMEKAGYTFASAEIEMILKIRYN